MHQRTHFQHTTLTSEIMIYSTNNTFATICIDLKRNLNPCDKKKTTAITRCAEEVFYQSLNLFIENTRQEFLEEIASTIKNNNRVLSNLCFACDLNLKGGTVNELQQVATKPEHKYNDVEVRPIHERGTTR